MSVTFLTNIDKDELQERIDGLSANGTVVSEGADYAEVGEWSDGNPNDEDRIGYFVSVDTSEPGKTMIKATADSDVRGVTMAQPAFAANASKDKYDSDGNLLPQFDYVCWAGFAPVIDNGTCTVNGRCIPDNDGTAQPSTNNLGYQVIERIDDTHVLVLVEPQADMIMRIKEDVSKLSEEKANKSNVPVSAEVDENNLVSFKNSDGIVLFTVQLLNGGGSIEDEGSLSPFATVNWLNTVYAVGENSNYEYNGWCPNTVAYDNQSGKIIFMQTHGPAHSSGVKDKTLVTIDPYDPTVYEKVDTFPSFTSGDGVGGLIVENGVWTAYGMKKRHRSEDFGATWETVDVATPPACMYGVFKIDDVLYCGDDYSTTDTSHNGYYYVSHDDGLTWEQEVFDFADDYEIPCSEARFAKWQGELYAAIRREDNTGLLAKQVDGAWTVIFDQLPNVSSDSSLLSFEDVIAVSSIDRPNLKLILSVWDGETLSTSKEYDFTGITASGDFHTPTYICGDDWQAVFFMTNGHGNTGYYSAMNAAIFGYADGVEANTPSYEVERVEDFSWTDLSSEPAYLCAPVVDDTGVTINPTDTSKTPWLNSAKRLNNSYPPDENGNIYYYGFTNAGIVPTHVPTQRYGLASSYLDAKQVGDRIYVCVVAKANSMADLGDVKMMGVANKIIVSDSDMSGATYCVTGFTFAGTNTYGNGWFSHKPYRVKQE